MNVFEGEGGKMGKMNALTMDGLNQVTAVKPEGSNPFEGIGAVFKSLGKSDPK